MSPYQPSRKETMLTVKWYLKELDINLILDGNSEIVAHVRRNTYYFICLRPRLDREKS